MFPLLRTSIRHQASQGPWFDPERQIKGERRKYVRRAEDTWMGVQKVRAMDGSVPSTVGIRSIDGRCTASQSRGRALGWMDVQAAKNYKGWVAAWQTRDTS